MHLGNRKPRGRRGKPAAAGKWVVRHYIGKQAYIVSTIGIADDYSDSDGIAVLNFGQAQANAREHMVRRVHIAAGIAGPLAVEAAVEDYFNNLEGEGRPVRDPRHRAEAFIYPTLGNIEVASLTTDVLRKWLSDLAKMPARVRTKVGAPQSPHDGDDVEAVRRRRLSANRVLTILKAALNQAFNNGKTPSDTAWRKLKPFKNVDAARVRYLTVAEAQRFTNAADPEIRPMVMAALQTGARYGEFRRDGGALRRVRGEVHGRWRACLLRLSAGP